MPLRDFIVRTNNQDLKELKEKLQEAIEGQEKDTDFLKTKNSDGFFKCPKATSDEEGKKD